MVALQRSAGNNVVNRLLTGAVQRADDASGGVSTKSATSAPGTDGPRASTPTAAQESARAAADDAVNDFTQAKFRGIGDWSGVPESVRIQLLEKATHPDLFWVGPDDESALERCWSSFGGNFGSQVRAHQVIWERSIDRGADPENITQTRGAARAFKGDVRAAADNNLDANEDRVVQELLNFGIEPPWELVRPTQPDRNKTGSERGAPSISGGSPTDMLTQQAHLASVLIRYDVMLKRLESTLVGLGLTFQPGVAPPPGQSFELGDGQTMWDVTNRQWVALATEVSLITNAWPVLYSARMSGDLRLFADQANVAPDPANPLDLKANENRQSGLDAVKRQLTGVLQAIKKTRDADLDPLDLKPVHDALYLGRIAPQSGRTPVREVLAGILNDEKAEADFVATIGRLGLDAIMMGAMILGVIGTAGGAAIAIGVAALAAGKADTRADKLSTALGASVADAGTLVTRSTVSAAEAQAQQARLELAQTIVTTVLDLGAHALGDHLDPAAQQQARKALAGTEQGSGGAADDIRLRLRTAAGAASSTTAEGPMKPWGMPEHQRAGMFAEPVNVRLRGDGLPPIKDVVTTSAVEFMDFDAKTWTIRMNPKLVAGEAISTKHFNDMVEIAYHEARHCEQTFHIARWRKMQIANGRLPREEFAFEIPPDIDAAATPMRAGDPLEAQAKKWWESFYGTKSLKRAEIYENLDSAKTTLNSRTMELDNAPKVISPAERDRLERAVRAAEAEVTRYDNAYRTSLPEEVDAYAAGAQRGAWARKALSVRAAQSVLDSTNVRVAELQQEVDLYAARGVSGSGPGEAQLALNQARFEALAAQDELARARSLP